MKDNITDALIHFSLSKAKITGKIVRLNDSLSVLQKNNAPVWANRLTAELATLGKLLIAGYKEEGVFTLQLQAPKSPLSLVVAQYDGKEDFRLTNNYDSELSDIEEDSQLYEDINLHDIVKDSSYMVLTMDPKYAKRYQAISDIQDDRLDLAGKRWLTNSQQIDSEVKIVSAIDNDNQIHSFGIILYPITTYNMDDIEKSSVEDLWQEVAAKLKTLTMSEMLDKDISLQEILWRLFNENEVVIHEINDAIFKCRCSKEKMEDAIKSIIIKEGVDAVFDNKEDLGISCDYCFHEYTISRKDFINIVN